MELGQLVERLTELADGRGKLPKSLTPLLREIAPGQPDKGYKAWVRDLRTENLVFRTGPTGPMAVWFVTAMADLPGEVAESSAAGLDVVASLKVEADALAGRADAMRVASTILHEFGDRPDVLRVAIQIVGDNLN